jgi:hypothetical protein
LLIRFSVYMVVYRQVLIPWITLELWIEFKKFLMKVQCVVTIIDKTCCGVIQMIDVDGEYHHEVQVTLLDKILVKLITTIMA